ncbi:hypothetical protein BBJ28_00005034 [Nothophytophthora sp. Chile5]|nr:hypothetical protein BBJ28_00005034 [Nothophytophthora sp. Chile5]
MAPFVLWAALLLVSSLFDAVSAQADGNGTTLSGCQVCASSGDCAHAYRGEPGQFCGNWLDRANQRRPCCCPNNVVCKTSNYACNCAYSGSMPPYHGGDGAPAGLLWLWWFLPVLLGVLCFCGCCLMMFKRMDDQENGRIPMAAPVSSPGQSYGDAPVYASAPPAYGGGYGRGGMGAGTGAALGGTAGLLSGLWIGETLANAGHSGGGFGDGGGGGGGDFAGDF